REAGVNERERAFLALRRVERQASRIDFAVEANEGDSDRGFLLTVVRGVVRWRPRLDFAIETLSGRNIESIDPDVATLLRSALYQLLEMDAPSYAVVNEHVTIAANRFPRAKGFVNAVLRKATRVPADALVPDEGDAKAREVATGHPDWLLRRWIDQFGEERALRIAAADQEPSYPDLLVNTARISMEEAAKLLAERSVVAEASPFGIPVFRLRGPVGEVREEIERGLFHPMDEGSAIIAGLVEPERSVLDLAAAPGGKSLAMALRGARVVSHDLSLARLGMLRAAHPRFFGGAPKIVVGDGRALPFRKPFDVVLLDAPCSATGTLRKNPEVKLRLEEKDLAAYATLQLELLRAAASIASREIIYSTCSLEREENAGVVDAFLAGDSGFERFDLASRVPPPLASAVRDGALVLTPDLGTDGFAASGLRRRGSLS
ncbi:MAG TPA: transcription antitermination factor NusB, partial [Thermoanaerobaculia bacterium]|nr:transcription antitermination factor NusB [Thermoanaerobaculia bacterium]